jgi:hypothetical protein
MFNDAYVRKTGMPIFPGSLNEGQVFRVRMSWPGGSGGRRLGKLH